MPSFSRLIHKSLAVDPIRICDYYSVQKAATMVIASVVYSDKYDQHGVYAV